MGLVCKLVNTPLWRLFESKQHILDMNVKYLERTTFLRDSVINVVEFMLGNLRFSRILRLKKISGLRNLLNHQDLMMTAVLCFQLFCLP